MLKELPATLADSQLQSNILGIGVFGFAAFAVGVVGWQGFDGAFAERESFGHSGAPFWT
jgi:hypothetical protein